MTDQSTPPVSAPRHNRRMIVLTGVLGLQVLCAVFFLGDVIEDFRMGGLVPHTLFEGAVALVLFLGVVFCGHEVKRTIERSRRAEAAASAASGAFAQLIETRFEDWRLTASETEVAMLTLKGFDVGEIAGLRNTAQGTVRAQLARIYAKSGATNRSQFVCLFIDDLLDAPIAPRPGADRRPAE